MVWVPSGALVAGSDPDAVPRAADREMRGEQVILNGFHIDRYPYPNESGAIPMTNVTRDAAANLCAEVKKRLCTELEWERACKGRNNHRHAYGDRFRPEVCGSGGPPSLRPSGLRVGCKSDLGVSDLHGGIWEWTASPWGRGDTENRATVRGGNGVPGDLHGRCAYADGRDPKKPSGLVGFRCCAGDPNGAEVVLQLKTGRSLEVQARWDKELAAKFVAVIPTEARKAFGKTHPFKVDRAWIWRPIDNEEVRVFGGCAGFAKSPVCGMVMGRERLGSIQFLAWASSDGWAPGFAVARNRREGWMTGADEAGPYSRRIVYEWGRIRVGPKQRRQTGKKKKR